MNELIKIAVSYYEQFDSPKYYIQFKSLSFWIALLASLMFISMTIVVFGEIYNLSVEHKMSMHFLGFRLEHSLMYLAEIVFLFTLPSLLKAKDKSVLDQIKSTRNEVVEDIEEAKIVVLKEYFGNSQYEFLEHANKIESIQNLLKHHERPGMVPSGYIREAIYSPDSRPRILALLIFLFSLSALLLTRSGTALDVLITIFTQNTVGSLLAMYIPTVITLWAVMVFVKTLFVKFGGLFRWFLSLGFSRHGRENWAISYLVRDLVELHKFKVNEENQSILLTDKFSFPPLEYCLPCLQREIGVNGSPPCWDSAENAVIRKFRITAGKRFLLPKKYS